VKELRNCRNFEGGGLMELTPNDIKKYVEKYLNKQFNEKIQIEIHQNKYYIINNELKFGIYDFWKKTDKELINDFKDFSFQGDYIGTIFFFLSGYWEYINNHKKDKFGRFPYKESFQFKTNIIEEPVVDILVHYIKDKLNIEYKNKMSCIFITHDIDHLFLLKGKLFYRTILGDIIKRKDLKTAFDKIIKKTKKNDPWNIDKLIELHKKLGTKGTFFFLPDIQPKKTMGGYNLEKARNYLTKKYDDIKKINGSIGIHYDARYLKENRMQNDVEKLKKVFEEKIYCGRSHFLIFDITKTFDILEDTGIKLDTTGGHAEHIGFRFGTSKPFRPFNFEEKREYNLIEVPLIVMDGTLQAKKYMNFTPQEGFEEIKKLVNIIKQYNGIFTFLWHNSSFYTKQWKDWESVYEETIKYALSNNLYSINATDILKYWSETNDK